MRKIYLIKSYVVSVAILLPTMAFSQSGITPINAADNVNSLRPAISSGLSVSLTYPNDSTEIYRILTLRINGDINYGRQYLDSLKKFPAIKGKALGIGDHLRKAAEITFLQSYFRFFLYNIGLAKLKSEQNRHDLTVNKIDTRFLQFTYDYIADVEKKIARSMRAKADIEYGNEVSSLIAKPASDFEFGMIQADEKHIKLINASIEHENLFIKYKYQANTVQNMRVVPVSNSKEAELYYNNLISSKGYSVLRSALFTYNPSLGKASLFSELFSDFIGPVRVALGTQITNKSEITKDSSGVKVVNMSEQVNESIQRILGGGGNFVLSLGYPLTSYKNKSQTLSFLTSFQPKFNLDVPQLGTETSVVNWSGDIGIDVGLYGLGLKGVIIPYLTSRQGFVVGGNSFYKYLGITGDKNRSFFLHQTTFGLAITSLFRIGVNFYYGDPFVVKNFPITVSVNIIPGR